MTFALAEAPLPLDEAARRYGAPYGALAGFALPPVDAPLEEVGRHACVYDGVRFGHVVLRDHGALVSLLVTQGEAPTAARLETDDEALAVAALPAGRFAGFVVARLDRAEVLRLAQAVAPPLSALLT